MPGDGKKRGHDIVVVGASACGVDEALIRDASFEAVPVAQIVVDRNVRLTLANLQARAFFGLTHRDLGRPLKDLDVSFKPVELRSRIEQVFQQRDGIELRDVEWQVGSEVRHFDIQIAPLIASGEMLAAGVSFIEVTRYRRLQEALQDSRREMGTADEELRGTVDELEATTHVPLPRADAEELGAVVERLPTGVMLISRSNRRIIYVNNAARRMLHPIRLRRGVRVPNPWEELSLADYVRELFEPGLAPPRQVRVSNDHTYVVSGIKPRASNIAALLIDDVSERERRRRAEREFVDNAAHELITPLTGLVGAAHVLEAGAKEIPEDRDRFIAHIAEEAARLTRIARALLVLARAQSGEEPPHLEILPLGPLLEDAIDAAAGDGAARFEIDCVEELTVLADADLFAQAFENLVANALRHGSGAPVSVTAAQLPGSAVGVELAEAGHATSRRGQAPDVRRFHSGAGRDSGGFGLGLSIATQSIEVMGGNLVLGSDHAPGVVARIELPSGQASRA